jgi:hypothetical protein
MKSHLPNFHFTSQSRQDGMALVITLALIVLVTVAAVAFLTRATGNRTVEASRSNQVLSEQLAKTGADYTISSFLNEIALHSTPSGGTLLPQALIYMIPQRVFAAGNAGATSPASSSFPQFANLVRQSVLDPILETNASLDSTTLPSQNGATVDVNQWSLPDLITGGFTATNQLPNWIYVNKDGSFTSALTAQNASNVIGRFAYNTYDIGGLLDANVAGYDNTSGIGTNTSGALSLLSQIKGTLAGADLSILPGISSMSTFVQQRNPASYGSPDTYINAIRSAATNGFMTPPAGDLHFTTRQDLIHAAESGAFGFDTNSLPYLTHFTRELARPSLAGFSTMPTRFDLGNLISNVAIKPNLIGLKSTILNIYDWQSATTATTNDFFSVLYNADTVVSQGSGSSNGSFYVGPNSGGILGSTNWTDNTDFHARGLGMNIIDQFNGSTVDPNLIVAPANIGNIDQPGKKGLPYLSRVNVLYNISGTFPAYNFTFGVIPEVSVPPGGSDKIGTLFATNTAIAVTVMVTAYDGTTGSRLTNKTGVVIPPAVTPILIPNPTNNVYNVTFQNGVSTSRNWTNYILFDASKIPTPTTPMSLTYGFFPTTRPVLITLPNLATAFPPIPNPVYGFNVSATISGLCFALSSQQNSIWYNEFGQDPGLPPTVANPTDPLASAPLNPIIYNGDIYAFANNATTPLPPPLGTPVVIVAGTASNPVSGVTVYTDDPRTLRNAGGTFFLPTDTTMPDFNAGSLSSDLVALGLPDPVPTAVPYARSITDSEYWPTTNQINGVGELGEVFHEAPWRTIDFVSGTTGTAASADYPLLDLFSAFSTPPSGVRAGVLNLNTRQPLVLQSVLQGTPTSPSKPSIISDTDAQKIATEIIAMTNPDPNNPTAQPWTNRVQLIDLVQTNIANNQSAFQLEKTHHESIVRALGEVGQTRTWNLLIDVIAQAGHFSTNSLSAGASPSGSQFNVGGQDRIWVSTAIDRFTGQVVDRQVEQVK